MNDSDFKEKVCGDLGYIRGKVEILEKNYVPCEKESVKKNVSINRKMIWSLFGFWGIILLSTIGYLLKVGV